MEREEKKKKKLGGYSIKSIEIIPFCKRCTYIYQHILKMLVPFKEAHRHRHMQKKNYYFLAGISKYVSCYIGKLSLFSQIEWANIFAGNEIPFAFILDL